MLTAALRTCGPGKSRQSRDAGALGGLLNGALATLVYLVPGLDDTTAIFRGVAGAVAPCRTSLRPHTRPRRLDRLTRGHRAVPARGGEHRQDSSSNYGGDPNQTSNGCNAHLHLLKGWAIRMHASERARTHVAEGYHTRRRLLHCMTGPSYGCRRAVR